MYKGIYLALSGAVLKNRNMEIFAQNIANANTPGYKKEQISFKEYIVPSDNRRDMSNTGRSMAELSRSVIDYSSGSHRSTGNPLDLAIHGKGFFALEGGRYTRNGHFMIGDSGYLTTSSGVNVLGEGGPIAVQGTNIEISSSGEVLVDGEPTGKLKIVQFPSTKSLEKVGDGMFQTEETGEQSDNQISQGFLEESNVNAIKEMIDMLTAGREFESYQKIIHSFDEATSKVVNEMGK